MHLISIRHSEQQLPFHDSPRLSAGFPNPAEDYLEKRLSLDDLLISRPSSTFLAKVQGQSMHPTLSDGDIVVVDRSITASHDSLVVAVVNGEMLVKRLWCLRGQLPVLKSDNEGFADIPIAIDKEDWADTVIWGVVKGAVRQFR